MMKKNPFLPKQNRKDERVSVVVPVKVFEQTGYSHNVSASGILFELDTVSEIGSEISFELGLDTSNGKMTLKCTGAIVRKEAIGQKMALAVRITDSRFE